MQAPVNKVAQWQEYQIQVSTDEEVCDYTINFHNFSFCPRGEIVATYF